MLALNSGHTVGHVAAPGLIRFRYCKLAIQMIRYIHMLFCGFFVAMLRFRYPGIAVQLVEPGVRIRLQHTAEPRKMGLRVESFSVR